MCNICIYEIAVVPFLASKILYGKVSDLGPKVLCKAFLKSMNGKINGKDFSP